MDLWILLTLSIAAIWIAVIAVNVYINDNKGKCIEYQIDCCRDSITALYRIPRFEKIKKQNLKAVVYGADSDFGDKFKKGTSVYLAVLDDCLYICPAAKSGNTGTPDSYMKPMCINRSDIFCYCAEGEYVKYITDSGDEYCTDAAVRTAVWDASTGAVIKKIPVYFGLPADSGEPRMIKLYYTRDGEGRSITLSASCRETLSELIPEKDVRAAFPAGKGIYDV